MMKTLTLTNVAGTLAERAGLALDQRVTGPQPADRGAVINPAWGLPSPGSNAASWRLRGE
jgi:hypothetical protein